MSCNKFVQYSTSNTNDHARVQKTTLSVCDEWIKKFTSSNIPEPDLSAELIVAHVMGHKMFHQVSPDKKINYEQLKRIDKCCQRRLQRCPVQYVIDEWDFHDLTLKMREPVFIPRPETEELAQLISDELEAAFSDTCDSGCLRFLEIGCGTGALSLYLLHKFPKITGIAVDKSVEACDLTRENADNLGLSDRLHILNMDVTCSDSLSRLQTLSPFDVILSNPPYIPTDEMKALETEIAEYEDHGALHGGLDGLDLVRHILGFSSSLLKPNGQMWLEVDRKHPPLIQNLVNSEACPGLVYIKTYLDFMNRERFCMLKRSR